MLGSVPILYTISGFTPTVTVLRSSTSPWRSNPCTTGFSRLDCRAFCSLIALVPARLAALPTPSSTTLQGVASVSVLSLEP